MSVQIKEIDDIDDIKAVLCHEAIYGTISGDGCPSVEDFEPPVNDDYLYVGGYVKGEIAALMVYHKYLDGVECHVQVLPEFRRKYAKEFGEQSLMFRGNRPLYAEIPELYQNVLEFAKLNGFEVIGFKDDLYIKNGVEYPINILRYNDGIC